MKKYLRQNRILFLLTLVTSIISSFGYVFIAILLQQLLDMAMAQDLQQFMKMVFFSFIYFTLLGIFLYLQSLLGKKVICKIMYQIRLDMFKGTINYSIEDFTKKNTADYISAITNDVKILEDNYLLPLFEIIQYTVIFISSFVLMIYFDIIVTASVISAITIMFIVPSLLGGILEKKQNCFSQKIANFTTNLKDILSGFEVVKSYSMVKHMIFRFKKSNVETIKAKYSVDKLVALNEGLSAFLALMAQVVVLFLSAYFIIIGRITVGTLLGMVQVSSNLANPLLMIFTNIPKIKSVHSIVEKLNGLSEYAENEFQQNHVSEFNHCISVTDLSFSYDGQKEVLHKINCVIRKGKKYVIVGKSGCGKTSLIKLLSGYYSEYDGKILYDDMELKLLDKNDVAQLSSTIHQNIYMFDETIYDNICLHEDYSKERVDKVVKECGLEEFISELPEGLFYKVGENGSNLSGGQKQRIAVARALIREKPILILDEGTSAIDMQTAFDIESQLLQIENLTLITITHNMKKELLEKYDKIVYMEEGKIIERGTFNELVSESSGFLEYFKLKK